MLLLSPMGIPEWNHFPKAVDCSRCESPSQTLLRAATCLALKYHDAHDVGWLAQERVECSSLIMASTVHQQPVANMIKDSCVLAQVCGAVSCSTRLRVMVKATDSECQRFPLGVVRVAQPPAVSLNEVMINLGSRFVFDSSL